MTGAVRGDDGGDGFGHASPRAGPDVARAVRSGGESEIVISNCTLEMQIFLTF